MKILITGGTGFLGTGLIRHLRNYKFLRDSQITLVSSGRTTSKIQLPPNVQLLKLDLSQSSTIQNFQGMSFDTVVHLATTSTLGPQLSQYDIFSNINTIDDTVCNLALLVKARHVIWASSGAIYGEIQNTRQTIENSQIKLPNIFDAGAYRFGKIKSEYHVSQFAKSNNIKLDIMRLFTFSGVDLPLNHHFALGNFIHDALNDNPINILGTGQARRSYLDQTDFSNIIVKLLQNPPSDLRLLNIGSPDQHSLEAVATIVQQETTRVFRRTPPINILRRFDDSHNFYVPDITALYQTIPDLNIQSLRASVAKILNFFANEA